MNPLSSRLRVERLDDRTAPAVLVTLAPGAAPPPGLEALGLGVYRAADPTAVAGRPGVLSIEPDAELHVEQLPDDPGFGGQSGLITAQAPAAWEVTTGTGQTIVAVIDSGIDLTHPDLRANLWTNPDEVPNNGLDDDGNGYADDVHGYDFANDRPDPTDAYGHGTHVAGILGAVGGNGLGVAGVNWRARIMPLRFLDAHGNGSTSDAVRALAYAVANGAKVSNNSWGGAGPSAALTAAVERARAAGHIVVAAAGNTAADLAVRPNFPASFATQFDNVLGVSATDSVGRLARFSSRGPAAALAAPGESILSTLPGGGTGTRTGTSMAAPFVSGAAALVWDQHPDWTYRQVIDQLLGTADPLPGATARRLNLARLVGGAVAPSPPVQPADPTPSGPSLGFVPTPVQPLPVARRDAVAVATVGSGQASVTVMNLDGSTRDRLLIPTADFAGGARPVATDLNGDGEPELILASAPGVSARVRVLDGATHTVLWDDLPFEAAFLGGAFVSAGDLTGDQVPDLIVTPDAGGGPRVRVFDGATFAPLADFFGIDDPNFRGGARTAVGDVTGDGSADLIVAAGFGGGPRVTGYDGRTVFAARTPFLDFFAFEPGLRNGVYPAVGDVDGDGAAELVCGAGPGGGPRVTVFAGARLAGGGAEPLADYFAGETAERTGVRVAVKDLDADGRADVVVGGTGRAAGYTGTSLLAAAVPTSGFGFDVPTDRPGAVFVG